VLCGVSADPRVGVRAVALDEEAAMPLYLYAPSAGLLLPSARSGRDSRGGDQQVFHQDIQDLAAALRAEDPLQHRRHLARLDALQHLDHGLQVQVLALVVGAVRGALQRAAQRALGIAAAEELAHLLADGADLAVGDGGERGVERGGVEVGGGVGVERVDVYGAPVIGEGGGGYLLNDGHFGGGWGGGCECKVR
jgi:hypothetical protein